MVYVRTRLCITSCKITVGVMLSAPCRSPYPIISNPVINLDDNINAWSNRDGTDARVETSGADCSSVVFLLVLGYTAS